MRRFEANNPSTVNCWVSTPNLGASWFPALTGIMKALRLPTRVSAVTYFVRFRRPRDPPVFVSAVALLEELEVPSWLGPWVPVAVVPALFTWTPAGYLRSPGDPSCTFLRSQTPVEPGPCHDGHVDAAPAFVTAKASDDARISKPLAGRPLRCTFLPGMPSPKTPGSSTSSVPDSDVDRGFRHNLLPTSLQSVSRTVINFGASTVHTFATACQFACPLARIRPAPGRQGLLLLGFRQSRSPFLPPDITTVATGLLYW
jgi:hypothetical protein